MRFKRHKHDWTERMRKFTPPPPVETLSPLSASEFDRFGFTTIEKSCGCGATAFERHVGNLISPVITLAKTEDE